MEQPHGTEQPPAAHDVVRDATVTANEMLKAFVTTAQLAQFPTSLVGPAGFQIVLQLIMLNNQSAFHNGVLQILLEVLERTKAAEGGLDPKAIQREMARRNVAVAMGPDPDVLQHLVQGSNYASVLQDQEMEELRNELAVFRTIAGNILSMPEDVFPGNPSLAIAKEQLRLLLQDTPKPPKDPGSVPENVPLDGTMPTPSEPQP